MNLFKELGEILNPKSAADILEGIKKEKAEDYSDDIDRSGPLPHEINWN